MAKPLTCDILVSGGTIIDGTGEDRFTANVAIRGDVVVDVGECDQYHPKHTIDAKGKVVAPGFIDAHTHDDRALLSGPDMTPKISQGVTTVVTGNCGVSLAPLTGKSPPPPLNLLGGEEWYRFSSFEEYVNTAQADPPALNWAMQVGHSTLRAVTMGDLSNPATLNETAHMKELLDAALDSGCIGFSTGLAYPTASAAPTDEVLVLAETAAARNAIHTTHMRNEGSGLVESVKETLEIGKRTGVPIVISHHKASGKPNWGKTKQTLQLIAEAQANGQSVDFDVYPYVASSTVLLADYVTEAERVVVTWSEPHPEVAGRDLAGIEKEWDYSTQDTIEKLLPAGAIYYAMDENELQQIMSFPGAMIGSDGLPHDAFPHPRLWGTFPRVLGHYSRDLGLFPLEQAVHRMTGKTASVFGFENRGVLRKGAFADVVVFDAESIIDRADFKQPKQTAAGIDTVLVNGQIVWNGSEWSGNRPGCLIGRN